MRDNLRSVFETKSWAAIGDASQAFKPGECANDFKAAGYGPL